MSASVVEVMPGPVMLYFVGVPVEAVYGSVNDIAPAHIAGIIPKESVGSEFSVTTALPVIVAVQPPAVLVATTV
jgi:hypothetical protein